MKITINPSESSEHTFPKLMILRTDKTLIVLVSGVSAKLDFVGTVLQSTNKDYFIGEYHDTWDSRFLVDFHGSITIES